MRILLLSVFLFTLSFSAPLSARADSDLGKTCKASYKTKKFQNECLSFCQDFKDYKKLCAKVRNVRVQACQTGQIIYLKTIENSDRNQDTSTVVKGLAQICAENYLPEEKQVLACQIGVTAEDLRKNPKKKGPGTSHGGGEREIGR